MTGCGMLVLGSTQVLSVFHALTGFWVAVTWGLALVATIVLGGFGVVPAMRYP